MRISVQLYTITSAGQSDMPRFIEGVPTLFLDHDTDIDLTHDVAAKEEYGRKIRAFFEYVQQLRSPVYPPGNGVNGKVTSSWDLSRSSFYRQNVSLKIS